MEKIDNEAAKLFAAFQVIEQYSRSQDYDETLVAEAANAHRMSGDAFGAVIMQYFDRESSKWEGDGANRPSVNHKKFLVEVAEALGPDHMENLRWATAFMQKVESF